MVSPCYSGESSAMNSVPGSSETIHEVLAVSTRLRVYQVAAPTELGTPTMHRAKIAQLRVRMEGWRQTRPGSNGRNPQEEKEKKDESTLDSYRSTHRRHVNYSGLPVIRPEQSILTRYHR